jgi:hypothetical protein
VAAAPIRDKTAVVRSASHGRHAAVTEAVRPARRIGAQIVQGKPRSFVVAASRHSRLPGVWTRAHRMARVLHIPAGTGERPPR